ncbi:NAD(P)/FAD-dependent oxidoreductase [bacterium]|nr:NAD(P)/FAD-dependent oxidoreductase [bacterium]
MASPAGPRVVVIGAGMAGVLAAIELERAGYEHVIYEKADRIGGTWRENTYPGIACDVPSHFYSYSFAPNPEWSHRFAPGAEIRAYFEDVARRYGVDRRIRHGTEIERLRFEDGRWRIEARGGLRDEADAIVAATGVLHHPSIPDLPGLGSFAGACFHSARWDHSVALDGRRVGVVGTGSSAVQITTELAPRVGRLVLFQRTPQWITPVGNSPFTEEEKAAFRADPQAILRVRDEVADQYINGFSNHLSDMNSPQLQAIHAFVEANLEAQVRDPALRERLRPDYRAGCKRMILSDGFYDAIQRPNAELVTDPIERIEPGGVRTRDGVLHELDVLVLATGFRVDRFLRPIEVVGRDGLSLDRAWDSGPAAYMALVVPGFPNLFMLNGPNGPVGNFSLIDVVELQFAWVLQVLARIRAGEFREAAPSEAAMGRFDAERREAARRTIWASGCRSWYLDADSLPTAWPWTYDRFREEMRGPRFEDFDLR